MQVYFIDFELSADSVQFSEEGLAGGFVTCYLPAIDMISAIKLSVEQLEDDGYTIASIDKAERYDPEEHGEHEEIRTFAEQSKLRAELVYGPFNVFGH